MAAINGDHIFHKIQINGIAVNGNEYMCIDLHYMCKNVNMCTYAYECKCMHAYMCWTMHVHLHTHICIIICIIACILDSDNTNKII